MPVRRVFLWTAPRSISTAFEFSIATLENVKVFHEVFSSPYYSDKTNPYQALLPERTFADSKNQLLTSYPGKDVVFTKEQAYFVSGRFDMLLDADMKDFVHTFLIRDPKKAVPSGYRAVGNLEQWYKFYPEGEVGFRELRDLYYFVKDNIDPCPVVIDADDLLENPEGMMKAYSQRVGIEFKDGMTKWEAGSMRTQDFTDQKGGEENLKWNEAALRSSGLSKSVPCATGRDQESLPEKIVKCIEEYTPLYHDLYQFRLVLDT